MHMHPPNQPEVQTLLRQTLATLAVEVLRHKCPLHPGHFTPRSSTQTLPRQRRGLRPRQERYRRWQPPCVLQANAAAGLMMGCEDCGADGCTAQGRLAGGR
jgi:hypothetical protein